MHDSNSENNRPIYTTEPSTTILDEGKSYRILTELPNMDEEKIRIDLENNPPLVTIVAKDSTIHYKTVMTFPCELRFSKKRFSNGVLELILEKVINNPI